MQPVDRILQALRPFVLINRELNWYRVSEPEVYRQIREALEKAVEDIRGNN